MLSMTWDECRPLAAADVIKACMIVPANRGHRSQLLGQQPEVSRRHEVTFGG
jgi:hypothetical protein